MPCGLGGSTDPHRRGDSAETRLTARFPRETWQSAGLSRMLGVETAPSACFLRHSLPGAGLLEPELPKTALGADFPEGASRPAGLGTFSSQNGR